MRQNVYIIILKIMTNESPSTLLLDSLQQSIQTSHLANYLQKFSSIETYREIGQGKQLIRLFTVSPLNAPYSKVIKKLFTFYRYAQPEGKVCLVQFMKQVMEIGKLEIYKQIQKNFMGIFSEVCEYRGQIKKIGRGSSYFMRQQQLHENSKKFNEMTKLSNTFFRMIHEMLYVWAKFYFPNSKISKLYDKISKNCAFPEFPSQFKFYSQAKINRIKTHLQSLSNQITKQSTVTNISPTLHQQKNKKPPLPSKKQHEQPKQLQLEQQQQQQDQQMKDIRKQTSSMNSNIINSNKHKKIKHKGKKQIPPNVVYRQSSIEDPEDATLKIEKLDKKYKQPANPNLKPKTIVLDIPMGIIEQRNSESKKTSVGNQFSRQNTIKSIQSLKKQSFPNSQLSQISSNNENITSEQQTQRKYYQQVDSPIQQVEQQLQKSVKLTNNQQKQQASKNVNKILQVKQVNLDNLLQSDSQKQSYISAQKQSPIKQIQNNKNIKNNNSSDTIQVQDSLTYSQLMRKQQQEIKIAQQVNQQAKNRQKYEQLIQEQPRLSCLLKKQMKQIEQKKQNKHNIVYQTNKHNKSNKEQLEHKVQEYKQQRIFTYQLQKQENKQIVPKIQSYQQKNKQQINVCHQKQSEFLQNQTKTSIQHVNNNRTQNKKSYKNFRKFKQFSLTIVPQTTPIITPRQNTNTLQQSISQLHTKLNNYQNLTQNIKSQIIQKISYIQSNQQKEQNQKLGKQNHYNLTGQAQSRNHIQDNQLLKIPYRQYSSLQINSHMKVAQAQNDPKNQIMSESYHRNRAMMTQKLTSKLGKTSRDRKQSNSSKKSSIRKRRNSLSDFNEFEEGTMLHLISTRKKSVYM